MPFFSEQENILQLNVQQFDFNIQFEQLFFSIIPSALFIVTSLWRAASQLRKPTVVDAPIFRLIKLGFITAYFGLDICLLVLVAVGSFRVTSIFIASSVLKLVSTVFMIVLSLVDHSKSPRPSVLLNSYLFLTLLLDAAQARTFFLASHDQSELNYSSIFVVAIAIKVGILLLEAQRKTKWVRWDDKEHSPEESSGIFSLGVYFWLNRIFFDGYKKVLTIKDLYPLDSSLKAESLHEQFSKNLDYSQMKGDKYGLVKVLLRTLRVSILLPIPPRLALLGFTFAQPFFIERLLGYLTESDADPNIGYGFIGASFLIYFGIGISTALYWYFHHRMRAMARSALVTEIFLKATKVRIGADDDSAALTLMSTDIERINMGLRPLHDIWASIIQVGIASWMLYNQLGVVFVAPMGLVALCSIGLGILMNFTGDSQRAWMAGVQKRVGLTATVIANMKNLKISGLSGVVGDFVQKLRVEELAAGARFRRIFIVAALLGFIPMLIAPPLTFAFAQRTLDVSRIFTSLSWLLLLTNPLGQLFQSIPEILSALACLGRIQAFLETENRQEFRQILDLTQRKIEGIQLDFVVPPESDELVIIKNGRFGWKADEYVLRDINTRIARASLTIVVGPVGSGKSTFCKTLIGEIPFNEGSITLSNQIRHVGFCDQVAFLSNGSIRENIVGFSAYDEDRYADIIQATSLNLDLETLPQGDRTNIGSDGITLSGGQKQRVALARALYLQTDLLILDDVFSGLDADTEEQVYRQVFGPDGLLRQRRCTVVLCTHSIKHIPAADYIIALGGGTIAEQGTYSQLVAHQGYIQRLGLSESPETSASSDKSISEESMRKKKSENLHTTTTRVSAVEPEADILRQVGNKKVYIHYFKSMGLVPAASGLLCSALLGFFTNFSTIWLKYWSDDAYSEHPAHSYAFYAGIYALLQVCAILSLLLLAIAFVIASVKRAGANLHRDALRTLIRAPLRFFTTTDTGVTTNLFSQDLNLIDTELPMALLNTLYNVFEAIGQAAVMITSSPFIAISYPFLAGILYLLQMFYLRTSRQLRLLDLEAKSPMYTHFLDTLKGIATLRAFGFIPEDLRKNIGLLNASQRPAYLLVMIQQWLSLVLDLVVMMMSVILTTLAVKLHSNAGFMGASLVTLMNFGESLSGIVIFYTQLETSIGAISRLKTFNESVIPEDQKEEDIILPEQWPQNGVIELKGISASYNMETEQGDGAPNLALRNIKLAIKSGEKIAICGRTGSGKSSLVALLLKLLDPTPETLKNAVIDDVPLYRINRSSLRQRIIAVPQEAVFLPDGSTFKTNIDPLDISTAEECKNVLSAVGMIKFVQERGGLDAGMSAGSLSAGQRQLLSLGRALLRRRARARSAGFGADSSEGGILLLDEVSSSVDHETERVMQEIIRTEFKDYTVVAVSHRLDMIMDFDRVVVMDTGEIVEVGNPIMLSQKEGSRFGDLVKAGPVRVAVTGTGEIMQRKTT